MMSSTVYAESIGHDMISNVSYKEAVEEIIIAINERDSYYFEVRNPENPISYIKSLGIDIPENLNANVTRLELAKLIIDISSALGDVHYTTNLIDMNSIFVDLEGLSEEDVLVIEKVFVSGLFNGITNDRFGPNELVSRMQLDIITNHLESGYSRDFLFDCIDYVFPLDEKNKVLGECEDYPITYVDMVNILYKLSASPCFVTFKSAYDTITIKEFLKCYSEALRLNVVYFDYESGEVHYPIKDSWVLSNEEWDYLERNFDREILYSEAMILYERAERFWLEIDELDLIDSWEEVEFTIDTYLPGIKDLLKQKNCISYFMDLGSNDMSHYKFSLAMHEAQHEGSAKLSNSFGGRRKSDNEYFITWSHKPDVFYYFDFSKNIWVDSDNLNFNKTQNIYNLLVPENLRDESFLTYYFLSDRYIANTYGLHGILQEFCSYALEAKVEFVLGSMDINNCGIGRTDFDNYLYMKYMVIEYINYLKENNSMKYEEFMNDTDVIRMINNIFEEMDFYFDIYRNRLAPYIYWFTDDLIEWGDSLNCYTFSKET